MGEREREREREKTPSELFANFPFILISERERERGAEGPSGTVTTGTGKKVCPRLREPASGPGASSQNLGQTCFAISGDWKLLSTCLSVPVLTNKMY